MVAVPSIAYMDIIIMIMIVMRLDTACTYTLYIGTPADGVLPEMYVTYNSDRRKLE